MPHVYTSCFSHTLTNTAWQNHTTSLTISQLKFGSRAQPSHCILGVTHASTLWEGSSLPPLLYLQWLWSPWCSFSGQVITLLSASKIEEKQLRILSTDSCHEMCPMTSKHLHPQMPSSVLCSYKLSLLPPRMNPSSCTLVWVKDAVLAAGFFFFCLKTKHQFMLPHESLPHFFPDLKQNSSKNCLNLWHPILLLLFFLIFRKPKKNFFLSVSMSKLWNQERTKFHLCSFHSVPSLPYE